MRKLVGLTVALASVIGFSSLITVNAEGADANSDSAVEVAPNNQDAQEQQQTPAPDTYDPQSFAEIQTRAKINMSYNPETKEVSKISVKFGGKEKASLFDKAATDYGMIVLAKEDPLATNGQINDKNIDLATLDNLINQKHYALSLTDKIKPQLEAGNEFIEYYWVIKNTFPLGYEKEFTAAAYQVLDGKVIVAKAKTISTKDIVAAYSKMAEDPKDSNYDSLSPLKGVFDNFLANYEIQYKVNTGNLYSWTPEYGYGNGDSESNNNDNWFQLGIYAQNPNGENKFIKADKKDNVFTFSLNHNWSKFKFAYIKNEDEFRLDYSHRESKNLKIENGKIIEDTVTNHFTYDEIKKNAKSNNIPPVDKNLVNVYFYSTVGKVKSSWVQLKEDENGNLLPFEVNTAYDRVIFSLKDTNAPDFNFNNQWVQTYDLKIENGVIDINNPLK